jgi:hypothetical protein
MFPPGVCPSGTVVELFGELRSAPDMAALQAGALAGAVSAAAALLQTHQVGRGVMGAVLLKTTAVSKALLCSANVGFKMMFAVSTGTCRHSKVTPAPSPPAAGPHMGTWCAPCIQWLTGTSCLHGTCSWSHPRCHRSASHACVRACVQAGTQAGGCILSTCCLFNWDAGLADDTLTHG